MWVRCLVFVSDMIQKYYLWAYRFQNGCSKCAYTHHFIHWANSAFKVLRLFMNCCKMPFEIAIQSKWKWTNWTLKGFEIFMANLMIYFFQIRNDFNFDTNAKIKDSELNKKHVLTFTNAMYLQNLIFRRSKKVCFLLMSIIN